MIKVEIEIPVEIFMMIEYLKNNTYKGGSLCAKIKDPENIKKWEIEWCPDKFTKHSIECSSIEEGIRFIYERVKKFKKNEL